MPYSLTNNGENHPASQRLKSLLKSIKQITKNKKALLIAAIINTSCWLAAYITLWESFKSSAIVDIKYNNTHDTEDAIKRMHEHNRIKNLYSILFLQSNICIIYSLLEKSYKKNDVSRPILLAAVTFFGYYTSSVVKRKFFDVIYGEGNKDLFEGGAPDKTHLYKLELATLYFTQFSMIFSVLQFLNKGNYKKLYPTNIDYKQLTTKSCYLIEFLPFAIIIAGLIISLSDSYNKQEINSCEAGNCILDEDQSKKFYAKLDKFHVTNNFAYASSIVTLFAINSMRIIKDSNVRNDQQDIGGSIQELKHNKLLLVPALISAALTYAIYETVLKEQKSEILNQSLNIPIFSLIVSALLVGFDKKIKESSIPTQLTRRSMDNSPQQSENLHEVSASSSVSASQDASSDIDQQTLQIPSQEVVVAPQEPETSIAVSRNAVNSIGDRHIRQV